MDEKDIFKKIKEMMVVQLGVDENSIKEESNLADDLDVDSLEIAEFIMKIEEEFNIRIPDEDVFEFTTVGDAIKYIADKTK